jgi:hypothetical protein
MMRHDSKMPFGKYKGVEMSKVPSAYRSWFLEQDWTEEKFPDIYEYFESGGQSAGPLNPSADVAQQEIDEEIERKLFDSVDLNFTRWFLAAYGATKKTHPQLYLPYLRIAATAWAARGKSDAESIIKAYQEELNRKNGIEPPKPAPPPPPKKVKGALDYLNDPLDEDVPF